MAICNHFLIFGAITRPSERLLDLRTVDSGQQSAHGERMTRLFAAGFIAALALAGVSLAAATVGWTPAQARAELMGPNTTLYGSEYGSPIKGLVAFHSAACHGLGKATKGTYALFSCSMAFTSRLADGVTSATAWVRPWTATALCVTQTSAGTCPPPLPAKPLMGDPRKCGSPDLARCVQTSAQNAIAKQRRVDGFVTESNLACQAPTAFVYRCSWNAGAGVGTVKFVAGKSAWSTVVTTNDSP